MWFFTGFESSLWWQVSLCLCVFAEAEDPHACDPPAPAELRQELAATKAQLAQASQVQQSAAQEAQATGHEAGELKQRLQAAEAEIGSLRAWIDQAIEAQAGAALRRRLLRLRDEQPFPLETLI